MNSWLIGCILFYLLCGIPAHYVFPSKPTSAADAPGSSAKPSKSPASTKSHANAPRYPKVPPFIAPRSKDELEKIYKDAFKGEHIPVNVNIDPAALPSATNQDTSSTSTASATASPSSQSSLHFEGFDLSQTARRLRTYFERLSRDELGVKAMQAAQSMLNYAPVNVEPWKDLDEIAEKLRQKFQHYSYIVSSTVSPIQRLYAQHTKTPIAPRLDCCSIDKAELRMETVYGCHISRRMSCDLFPRDLSLNAFNPGRNLTQIFSQNMNYWSQVKWFYFMSTEGLHTEYPSHKFSLLETTYPWSEQAYLLTPQFTSCSEVHQYRHRSVYVRSVLFAHPQRVVIVLDRGAMSVAQWNLGVRVLSHLILTLSERDRVHVVMNLGGTSCITASVCTPSLVKSRPHFRTTNVTFTDPTSSYPLTEEVKSALLSHVHVLTPPVPLAKKGASSGGASNPNGPSASDEGWLQVNHSLSLEVAFRLVRSMMQEDEQRSLDGTPDYHVVYISRGHSDDLQESRRVLDLSDGLKQQTRNETGRVVPIHTVLLLSREEAPLLFERAFLKRMSQTEGQSSGAGQIYVVHSNSNLAQMCNHLWNAVISQRLSKTTPPPSPPIRFSLPYRDLEGGGLVMSVSQAVFHQRRLLGVFGIDVHVADMVDSITYFSRESITPEARSYAFLLHREGYVISHPSLQPPGEKPWQVANPHVTQFEWQPQFKEVALPRMLRGEEKRGQVMFVWPDNNSGKSKFHKVVYYWQWLNNDTEKIPFIVVMKRVQPLSLDMNVNGSDNANIPITQQWHSDVVANMKDMHYHRLDFYHRVPSCYFMNDLATYSFSTVFLSARCYEQPFRYLSTQETLANVHHLVVYLTDVSKLLTNPGLKAEVRAHVAAVERINKFWLRSHEESKYKDYIVRRYVSTDLGVVRMYPGTMLHKAYDPTTREWYLKARKFPGKMVFTGPYLDPGGAGYIVTLSQQLTLDDGVEEPTPSEQGTNSSSKSGGHRGLVVVMGLDVTLPFLYQSLRHWLPACDKSPHVRCFLMDEWGYLVAHPFFLRAAALSGHHQQHQNQQQGQSQQSQHNSNVKASLLVGSLVNWLQPERNHITHQEPLMSDEFLQKGDLVRKISCPSWWSGGSPSVSMSSSNPSPSSNTAKPGSAPMDWWLASGYLSQRMYRLNMSWNGVASNVPGHLSSPASSGHVSEPCTKYQLVRVPNTNLFLGVLNESRSGPCASRTAFCPCNILDRQCLDCQRVDMQACECPCECPLSHSQCRAPTTKEQEGGEGGRRDFGPTKRQAPESGTRSHGSGQSGDEEKDYCPKPDGLDFQLQRSHLMSPFHILSVASRLDATASLHAATLSNPGSQQEPSLNGPADKNPSLPLSSSPHEELKGRTNSNSGTGSRSGGPLLHAQCIQPSDCSPRKTRMACMGVVGCTWCELKRERALQYFTAGSGSSKKSSSSGGTSSSSSGTQGDGTSYYHYYLTPLTQPYCALQEECFGGVKEGQSPYALARNPSLANDPYLRRLGHRVLSPYHYLGGNGMGELSEQSVVGGEGAESYLFYPQLHPHQRDPAGHNPVWRWQNERENEEENFFLPRGYEAYANLPYFPGDRIIGDGVPGHGRLSADNTEGAGATFSSPFGPIAGGVMACFVFVLLAAYCYRSRLFGAHAAHLNEVPYQAGLQDPAGQEELLEEFHRQDAAGEEDEDDDKGGGGGGGNSGGAGGEAAMLGVGPLSGELSELDLDEFECNPTALSPYRVNAGYQRGMNAQGDQPVRPRAGGGGSSVASVGGPDGGSEGGVLPRGDSSIATDDDVGYSSTVQGPAPVQRPSTSSLPGPPIVKTASSRRIKNYVLDGPSASDTAPDVEDTASSAADGGQSVVSEQDSAIGSSVMGPAYDMRRAALMSQHPLTCPLGTPLTTSILPSSGQPTSGSQGDPSSHIHVVTL